MNKAVALLVGKQTTGQMATKKEAVILRLILTEQNETTKQRTAIYR